MQKNLVDTQNRLKGHSDQQLADAYRQAAASGDQTAVLLGMSEMKRRQDIRKASQAQGQEPTSVRQDMERGIAQLSAAPMAAQPEPRRGYAPGGIVGMPRSFYEDTRLDQLLSGGRAWPYSAVTKLPELPVHRNYSGLQQFANTDFQKRYPSLNLPRQGTDEDISVLTSQFGVNPGIVDQASDLWDKGNELSREALTALGINPEDESPNPTAGILAGSYLDMAEKGGALAFGPDDPNAPRTPAQRDFRNIRDWVGEKGRSLTDLMMEKGVNAAIGVEDYFVNPEVPPGTPPNIRPWQSGQDTPYESLPQMGYSDAASREFLGVGLEGQPFGQVDGDEWLGTSLLPSMDDESPTGKVRQNQDKTTADTVRAAGGIPGIDALVKSGMDPSDAASEIDKISAEFEKLASGIASNYGDMESLGLINVGLGIAGGTSPYFAENMAGGIPGIENIIGMRQKALESQFGALGARADLAQAKEALAQGDEKLAIDWAQLAVDRAYKQAMASAKTADGAGGMKTKDYISALQREQDHIRKVLSGVDELGNPLGTQWVSDDMKEQLIARSQQIAQILDPLLGTESGAMGAPGAGSADIGRYDPGAGFRQ